MFCTAIKPTPLFNHPNLRDIFSLPLALNEKNLLLDIEMVAFPGTVFDILSIDKDILEVRTGAYPVETSLFLHRHFVSSEKGKKNASLPETGQIIRSLLDHEGAPYVWGGNYVAGINDFLELFPPKRELSEVERYTWRLAGVDCSGLLYAATNGFTPRNTSMLFDFGMTVSKSEMQPLDLLLWDGHVVIVLPNKQTIESRALRGVFRTPLDVRLEQIHEEAGDTLVVKRWL